MSLTVGVKIDSLRLLSQQSCYLEFQVSTPPENHSKTQTVSRSPQNSVKPLENMETTWEAAVSFELQGEKNTATQAES